MKLYMTDTSPYARIVRMVVLEKGLEKKIEMVLAQTRMVGSPYYEINPSGRVPYLVRDDGVGFEDSAVICSYLDQFRDPQLFDLQQGEEAWETRRLGALAGTLLEGVSVWIREMRRPVDERSPTILAHELSRSERLIDLWEDQIDHPLMNGKLTMAQIVLITGLQMELQLPGFDWRPGHPKLSEWVDRMAERPSVAATVPATK